MRTLVCVALAAVGLASWAAAAPGPDIPAPARSEFDKAEIAREEGRLEDALGSYRKAIELHARYHAAHAGYLAALRGLGDLSEAEALYEKLVPQHADSVDLKAFQAATLPLAQSLPALQDLAAKHPANVRVHLELARAQLWVGQARDAEKTLKTTLKLESELPLARVLLGDVYFQQGKFTRARKEYQAAIEIDNAYVAGQLRLALCWHRAGKSDEALKIVGSLVSEDNLPRLVAGHWLLALIRTDLEKYEDALRSIDKVLEIDKNDYQALLAKGQILLLQRKPMAAAAIFALAAEGRNRGEALFCLGWAYEKAADAPEIQDAEIKERLAKAAEAYEKCGNLDPTVRPRDSLGFVYLLGQRHADAVTQFKRAKDIDPNYAPALNNLGLSSDIADNRAEAKRRYETVLSKIDKRNVRAHVMLALDLWLDGSATKAIKQLEKALKIRPGDDLAWTFLGDIHYDNKKVDRAIKAYRKATEINEQNFFAWYHMGIAYDDDKRRYEEADRCYEKAHQARVDPPVDLFLRLAEINDVEVLNRPEKALQYYQAYVDNGGDLDWVPDRIEELKELLSK
ncbi:MAG: tetratricopeptide repeat protein [Planctomycetota bacterium]